MATPLHPSLVEFIENTRLREEGKKKAGRKIVIYSLPKVGKTVLAARLGRHNMFISDEDGYTSLMNDDIKPLIGHWDNIPWMDWPSTRQVLQAGEAQQILCECGEPIDNWILDTMSGMVMATLQDIIKNSGSTNDGKVAPEAAGRPDYMLSRDRLTPVMQQIAAMRNASVTMLVHMREHGKVNPTINLDMHGAAANVMNKYASVQAYMTINPDGKRILQVKNTGNNVVAGSRYSFPKDFVTDDEFVEHVEKWKSQV